MEKEVVERGREGGKIRLGGAAGGGEGKKEKESEHQQEH